MPKGSNNSRGSKLGKMKTLRAHVKTLYDYPFTNDERSLTSIDAIIDGIESIDTDVATKLERYSTAVGTKQKGFKDGKDPLKEIVRKVARMVRSDMGRGSKEAKVIQKLAVKIRGTGSRAKPKKQVKTKQNPASAEQPVADIPNEKSISRSETTFANRTKLFNDIIVTVQGYGTRYTGIDELSVNSLKDVLKVLNEMMAKSDEAHMQYKLSVRAESDGYLNMKNVFDRVKDGIEGHYGPKSAQFLAIKKLSM